MSKDPTASAKSSGDNAMLLLDNPVWHSLTGPQQRFAELSLDGRARRFVPEVSPFSAVDQVNEESWAALAELVGPQKTAVLVRPRVPPAPEGWTELFRQPCHQMIARDLPAIPVLELLQLGTADTDEIMSLVELTEPGPFRPRTIELGAYVGVRQAGRLMAMAGQRLHLPGWREISAVCTHPDARRQGLGAALTLWVAGHIREQGEEALLHVLATNESAVRLYEALGFEIRCTLEVVGNRWLAAESSQSSQEKLC